MADIFDIDYDKILHKVYEEHGQVIVAFDFDNTVYDYHKKGLDCSKVINLIKECDKLKFPLICLTSNIGDRLIFIKHYLNEVLGIRGIKFLGVNEEYAPKENTGFTLRTASKPFTKPYYNILLDDKSGLEESYNRLKKLVDNIKKDILV